MKKLFLLLFAAGLLASCGSGDTTTTSTDSTGSAPVAPGIDNVDGNVPDTSSTIQLNNTTTQPDSVIGTDSVNNR